jgi:hypothetical protein
MLTSYIQHEYQFRYVVSFNIFFYEGSLVGIIDHLRNPVYKNLPIKDLKI